MTIFFATVLVFSVLVVIAQLDRERRRLRRVRYILLRVLENGVLTIPEIFGDLAGVQECPDCAQLMHRTVKALVRHGFITATRAAPDAPHRFRITNRGIECLQLLEEHGEPPGDVVRNHSYLHNG